MYICNYYFLFVLVQVHIHRLICMILFNCINKYKYMCVHACLYNHICTHNITITLYNATTYNHIKLHMTIRDYVTMYNYIDITTVYIIYI